MHFTPRGEESHIKEGDYSLPDNFYEGIEKRMQELHGRGIDENEVKMLMGFDIENYFKNFIRNFEQGVKKDELSKVVDEKIINLVENFLKMAGKKLQKVFPVKVFYGLCLHLSSSINRLKSNKNIVNHNLKNIKKDYKNEFEIAKDFTKSIENMYKVVIPEDEVGFIAMFLTVDEMESSCVDDKPIVVIAMHGRATASSMAEVVNKLVGANNVYAYDMILDKSSKIAYEELKDIIIKKHQGAGVLLLVDMGSLNIFGELISKDTGIDIKVLDMVSTPIAIECSRKAVIETNINNIYNEIQYSMIQYAPYNIKVSEDFIPSNDNIIITLCTTGEGSAIKLKNFIETKINVNDYNVQVFPMSLNNRQHMYNTITTLSKKKNVLAIVGTINPKIYGIPYISTYEIFMDKDCSKIKDILDNFYKNKMAEEEESMSYSTFIESLQREISNMDLSNFEGMYKDFLIKLQNSVNRTIEYDISIGLMVHMVCCISSIISGKETPTCYSKEILKEKYSFEFGCIENSLADIAQFYNICFNDDEISFILRNILSI